MTVTAAGQRTPAGLPPGPEMSRARQTARWLARPVELMRSLQASHGDVFTVHLVNERPWVMVADPGLVKQVFTAPDDVLHAGDSKRILAPVVGPGSVLTSDGERHMRQRRLLLPAFHGARIARYEATMREVAAAEIERWPRGEPLPAAPRMSAIALDVILRTLFGAAGAERLGALRDALGRLVAQLRESGRSSLIALGESARLGEARFAGFRERIARADELIVAEVARRREAAPAEGEDVLSDLLSARCDDGTSIGDEELRDQLMTLVVAGHDTTATSLAWALERLTRSPAALRGLTAEAADGGGPYTEAVIRETLRARPVFAVLPRKVERPFRLGGTELPPGVAVTPCVPLVHHRPDVYPEPEAFRPERFLEAPPGTYTWIPFGGGARRCIGAGLSVLEMRVVLTTLLERAIPRTTGEEGERIARQGLLLAPARGARVALERR